MSGNQTLINVLLVDDEKEACANLESFLQEHYSAVINVVGCANNTREADRLIRVLAPDALFIDIEMPNENAFNYLERISPFPFEVVFVTAYDEYAIRAFKLNAVDYILKPISIVELGHSVQKLAEKIRIKRLLNGSDNKDVYSVLPNLAGNKVKAHRIALKDNGVITMVDFKDIYFVEAQGSYIKVIFLKDGKVKELTISGSLTDYEELLPSDLFFRIHKSYVINCLHVDKILKGDSAEVVVNKVHTLPVSRRRFVPMLEFLKSNDYYNE